MRTRTRTVVHISHPGYVTSTLKYNHYKCNGTPTLNVTAGSYPAKSPFALDQTTERMDDIDGTPIKPLVTNPVYHRAITERIYLIPSMVVQNAADSSSAYGVGRYDFWSTPNPDAHRVSYGLGAITTLNQWPLDPKDPNYWLAPPRLEHATPLKSVNILVEDAAQRAEQLQSDVLLNIVESSDLPNAVRAFMKVVPEFRKHILTREAVKATLKSSPSLFLAWTFGLKPFVSDMEKLYNSLPKLEQLLREFKQGKTLRYSSHSDGSFVFGFGKDTYTQSGQGVSWPVRYDKWFLTQSRKPSLRVTLRVKPTQAFLDSFLGNLVAFTRKYATSPAKLAWELVPYSFLVDWVIDIRSILRGVDRICGTNPYEITGASWSYTYRCLVSMTSTWQNACANTVLTGPHTLAECEYRHYERHPLDPNRFTIGVKDQRLGKSQLAILAALALQKLHVH